MLDEVVAQSTAFFGGRTQELQDVEVTTQI
jgi:hypothetical protein